MERDITFAHNRYRTDLVGPYNKVKYLKYKLLYFAKLYLIFTCKDHYEKFNFIFWIIRVQFSHWRLHVVAQIRSLYSFTPVVPSQLNFIRHIVVLRLPYMGDIGFIVMSAHGVMFIIENCVSIYIDRVIHL